MGWGTFQAKSEVSIVKVFPAFIQSFPKTVMARSHAVDRSSRYSRLLSNRSRKQSWPGLTLSTGDIASMLRLRLSLESLHVSPELTLYILVEMHASYDK